MANNKKKINKIVRNKIVNKSSKKIIIVNKRKIKRMNNKKNKIQNKYNDYYNISPH